MFNGECKLATIWLFSKDTKKAATFYRDILQMKQIEHGDTDSFDGRGLRQSIHPLPESTRSVPNGDCFTVFYVERNWEEARAEERYQVHWRNRK